MTSTPAPASMVRIVAFRHSSLACYLLACHSREACHICVLYCSMSFHFLYFSTILYVLFSVSARLGLKPSAEPTFTKASNNNNNNNTITTANAIVKPSSASTTATASEGKLTLKDLQGVFSSSLVSAASLDFLRVNTVVADDYADTK